MKNRSAFSLLAAALMASDVQFYKTEGKSNKPLQLLPTKPLDDVLIEHFTEGGGFILGRDFSFEKQGEDAMLFMIKNGAMDSMFGFKDLSQFGETKLVMLPHTDSFSVKITQKDMADIIAAAARSRDSIDMKRTINVSMTPALWSGTVRGLTLATKHSVLTGKQVLAKAQTQSSATSVQAA